MASMDGISMNPKTKQAYSAVFKMDMATSFPSSFSIHSGSGTALTLPFG
jgi:hypothetical protein